jgi:hypothetical protein
MERVLVDREGIESTMYVFEAPLDSRILAAWVVVRNTRSGAVMTYYVPAGVYVRDYSEKLDDYVSVSDLRYAGNILSEDRDIEYAIWQLNNLTGLSIDSYVWVDSSGVQNYSALFGDLSEFSASEYSAKYSNPQDTSNAAYLLHSFMDRFSITRLLINYDTWDDLAGGIRSNLTTAELIAKVTTTKAILNAGGVVLFDLSQPWATEEVTTSNGKTANIINYDQVDDHFSDHIGIVRGREVEREQVKVEVYNASGISGLASRYARKIQNSGMRVVRYENAPNEAEKTVLYIPKPEKYTNSLEIVKDLIVVTPEEITGRPSFITTGDIVVVLGKDMEKEVNWR